MPPRQKSLTRGRWSSIALSVLLHSLIVAVAVFAWKFWKRAPEPPQTLGIEATMVDPSVLKGASTKPPAPEPPPPEPVPEPQPAPETPPEEQGPPKPDPAEIERREQEERDQLEQQKRAQDEKVAQELKVREEADRVEQQKQAAAKAAAEKKRLEAEKEKAAADKKRADDAAAKKKADELAARKAADDKAREARENELRRSLAAEERGRALQNSDEANRWHAAIVARITRAWIRPPSAQPGIECIVSVTQVPGGEVTAVKVISCNGGDAALRDSVEAAVIRASPLPAPPDPALFERNLELTFAPTS